MISLANANRILDRFMAEVLRPRGFQQQGRHHFARAFGDASGRLSWPCRINSAGNAAFYLSVSVRHAALAEWLPGEDEASRGVFVVSFHTLRDGSSFEEREFVCDTDLRRYLGEIDHDIVTAVIPYFECYSQLRNLRAAAESTEPKDWISAGLSQNSRMPTLAAIQVVQGDPTAALRTLDAELARRHSDRPARLVDLQHMRRRIAAAQLPG